MLNKIREILLTKYIGSILVALLASQALIVLIETVLKTAYSWINFLRSQSVLGSSHVPFAWESLVFSAVTIALYLLLAYFLARWLYPADPQLCVAGDEVEPSKDQV